MPSPRRTTVTLTTAIAAAATLAALTPPVAAQAAPAARGVLLDVRHNPARRDLPADEFARLRVANLNARFDVVTNAQFVGQLNILHSYNPGVIMLQETQNRLKPMTTWAENNGYYLYAPGKGASTEHESVVMIRKSGRFKVQEADLRKGSGAVVREDGTTIPPRYIATVRVHDARTNRSIAFSSTHAVPEVQTWPNDAVAPRWGAPTLWAFRTHMKAVRAQVSENVADGALTILGGDLNTGAEYEAQWEGFPTQRFGDLLASNHETFGPTATFVADGSAQERAIDYTWTTRGSAVVAGSQRIVDTVSDHHAMILDYAVKVRR